MKSRAKNSHSNKNSKNDEKIKHPTRNSKEKTGCFETITIKAQKTKREENIINNVLEFI
jgi:hypothetical protein